MSPISNSLTAADIMQTDIVTVEIDTSLQEAMELMTENHVTGLPVLDAKNRCVGVISATDILNYEQEHAEDSLRANDNMARYFDPESQRWEDVRISAFALEEISGIPVGEIMSRQVISVLPDASISAVAEKMIHEEVHRVLVVDPKQSLLGLVSAVDFVRLFVT